MTDERKILDSGERREFSSGAVRDISENKGRMDLLPLGIVSTLAEAYYSDDRPPVNNLSIMIVFRAIDNFMRTGDTKHIYYCVCGFIDDNYSSKFETAILDLAIHYEQGAKKYAERNWEKGINCHCYIDSGLRHFLKLKRGDVDEPHDRAFMWNMLGLLWTLENKPEFNDLPFNWKWEDTEATFEEIETSFYNRYFNHE